MNWRDDALHDMHALTRGSVFVGLFSTLACGGGTSGAEPDVENGAPSRGSIAHKAIDSHETTTCAITPEGEIACWGGRPWGRLTNEGSPYVKVSVRSGTVCGLAADGWVRCWGNAGPLGHGYVDVSVGTEAVCTVRSSGMLECRRYTAPNKPFEPRPGRFVRVASGGHYTCGIHPDESAECWRSSAPSHVYEPEGRFIDVDSAAHHVCVIDDAGQIDCWGDDSEGQCQAPAGRFSQVSVGGERSCGLDERGLAHCWGAANEPPPQDVTFVALGTSESHACGLSEEGTPRCWGFGPGVVPPPDLEALGEIGESAAPCDGYTMSRFECELEQGWLSPYGFRRANTEPFQQQFGGTNLQNVWVSESEARLSTGDVVSAMDLYKNIDPDDLSARLEGTVAPGTQILHQSPTRDRFEIMVKGPRGSNPETNDWILNRLFFDGSSAPLISEDGYGEPGRTCMSCHVLDGRQDRTDLLWGIPQAVAL